MTKETKVITMFMAVVIFQIGWHWLLTLHNNASEAALRAYTLHSVHNRKGVAGYLDVALPAVLIGLLLGRMGWQWSKWKLAGFVLAFGAVLVPLLSLYAHLVTVNQAWWWPQDQNDLTSFWVRQTVQTLFLLTICVYGGRLWRSEQ